MQAALPAVCGVRSFLHASTTAALAAACYQHVEAAVLVYPAHSLAAVVGLCLVVPAAALASGKGPSAPTSGARRRQLSSLGLKGEAGHDEGQQEGRQ